MIDARKVLLALALGWAAGLSAGEAEALAPAVLEQRQAEGVSQAAGAEDPDVYYAPLDSADEASPTAGALARGSSYYSHADIKVFAWGSPGEPLKGAEVFLGGQFLGKTPLSLSDFLVAKDSYALTARLEGFEEAERPAVAVPLDGELRVALVDESAAAWYTTPSWIIGLGLLAGSVAAYANDRNTLGTTLVLVGAGVVTVTQLTARFVHLPSLRRQAAEYNQRRDSAP